MSLIARAGSSPVIFPAVCSAMTRLISARAASGASAKPTCAMAAAAASSSWLVNPGSSGRPDCTHAIFGARNVTDPSAATSRTAAEVARSPPPAASGASCSAPASSAAVRPRAPHSAICSAVATLTGEKTVSVASSVSSRYRSAPNASSAAATADVVVRRDRFFAHHPPPAIVFFRRYPEPAHVWVWTKATSGTG